MGVQAYEKGVRGGRRGELKKRIDSVVVAETLDRTQAEDKVTSLKFIAKGDLLHGLSAIALKNVFTENWVDYCQEIPTGSRRRTMCE